MNELFALTVKEVDGQQVNTINARELHTFLGVQTAFKDWIARRIEEYGFTDGQDFCSFLSESIGGRPAKEYAITLDMAKELSMVERNEKGKLARRYFIECERRLRAGEHVSIKPTGQPAKPLYSDPLQRLLVMVSAVEIRNGKCVTNSVRIAKSFRLRHNKVLHKIDSLSVSDKFREANFLPRIVPIYDAYGEITHKLHTFDITRNGFLLLSGAFPKDNAIIIMLENFLLAFDKFEAENKLADPLVTEAIQAVSDIRTPLAFSLGYRIAKAKHPMNILETLQELINVNRLPVKHISTITKLTPEQISDYQAEATGCGMFSPKKPAFETALRTLV